jgi:hypothetical protein
MVSKLINLRRFEVEAFAILNRRESSEFAKTSLAAIAALMLLMGYLVGALPFLYWPQHADGFMSYHCFFVIVHSTSASRR